MNWSSSRLQMLQTSAFVFYTWQCRQEKKHPHMNWQYLQLCSEADTGIYLSSFSGKSWPDWGNHYIASKKVQDCAFQFYPVAEFAVWVGGYNSDLFNQRQEVYLAINIFINSVFSVCCPSSILLQDSGWNPFHLFHLGQCQQETERVSVGSKLDRIVKPGKN